MFSALNQGSIVHILDKTDGLKYKKGEIIGITQPNPFGGTFGTPSFGNSSLMALKIKIDGEVKDYPDIPSNQSIMSYNNGNFIIGETTQGILTEVENFHKQSKQILANREYYEKAVSDCETIMKELSPQFAQDKERDDRINALDSKVSSIGDKLDKILNAIGNGNNVTVKV